MLAFLPLFCYGVISHMQKGDVSVSVKKFPVIDLAATGENIRRLRLERGMSVRDLQGYFGFEEPRAIYKWQKGESLPTVDNLYALGSLFEVPLEKILIPVTTQPKSMNEQQAEPCCSNCFLAARLPIWIPRSLQPDYRSWQPRCHGTGGSFWTFLACEWMFSFLISRISIVLLADL